MSYASGKRSGYDFLDLLRDFEEAPARQLKWDLRFLQLAKLVSSWSKDPSTQAGAVIVDPDGRVVSLGYNGFAKGVDDSTERYADRELKYRMVVHAEINAILFAERDRLEGATLYTQPFMCCSRCASQVIQSGITRCVAPQLPAHLEERWGEDIKLSKQMFDEAGVQLDIVDPVEELVRTYTEKGLAANGTGQNVLATFGGLGGKTCYLNIPFEEAVARYRAETGDSDEFPGVFRCGDKFSVYDAWSS
jgi:dCMP deaminase